MYAPLSPELVLRRDCSPDYTDADLGDPVLEVILQPGVRPCVPHRPLSHATRQM